MSDLDNAVSNLKQFGKSMKAIISVADALDGIVSLETHKSQLEAAVAAKTADVLALDAAIAEAQAKVEAAHTSAADILAAASGAAQAKLSEAAQEYDARVQAAQSEAGAILARAESSAEKIVDDLNAALAEKRGEYSQLAQRSLALREECEALDVDIAKREAKLAEIKAALAKLAE